MYFESKFFNPALNLFDVNIFQLVPYDKIGFKLSYTEFMFNSGNKRFARESIFFQWMIMCRWLFETFQYSTCNILWELKITLIFSIVLVIYLQ